MSRLSDFIWPLSQPPPNLFLTDNIKIDKIPVKVKLYCQSPFYIVFQVLKVILVNTWKIQQKPWSFITGVIRCSLYISRYHLSKIFRTSFNIIWKTDFQHKFSIFNILTRPSPPLHPLNGQKRDKGFSWCSLTTSPQPH